MCGHELPRDVPSRGDDLVPPEQPAEADGLAGAVGMAPGLLAAMCDPQGFGTGGCGAGFAQDASAEVLPPGPVLAALTEAAVTDVARLTDEQLVGVLRASRRQENREAWKKALVIAEFARRRTAEFEAAQARGVPVHCRPGQFPGEELAIELVTGPVQTSHAIDDAADLAARLPATLAGMAAGLIDEARAGVIALHTRSLSPADTALADGILAALAPALRLDQLSRKAAALEMKLNPEAVKARREQARHTRQRVEVFREESGNAAVAGREMDSGDALASKAHIHALALRLRRAGMPGTLDQLRLRVFADLTVGRNPLDRLVSPPVPPDEAKEQETGPAASGTPLPDYDHDDGNDPGIPAEDSLPSPASPPAPMPALINLVVHAGTLFGWDTIPTQAGGWGLLDADETRAIVAAASTHPGTRWCVTVTGADGTALAHGCSPGQHPWTPTPEQAAPLSRFLRRLNASLTSIATTACDHAHAEPGYTPSRRLKHLVHARTQTCDAPGCTAQAVHADLDHTNAYPYGLTDQCNLSPKCRRHHKAKQAPDWKVEQPQPGLIRWTLPSGRTHTTTPTSYSVL